MDFSPFQKKKPDWALGAKEGEGKARPSPIVTLSFFILFLIFSSFIFPYNLYAQYFQDCKQQNNTNYIFSMQCQNCKKMLLFLIFH